MRMHLTLYTPLHIPHSKKYKVNRTLSHIFVVFFLKKQLINLSIEQIFNVFVLIHYKAQRNSVMRQLFQKNIINSYCVETGPRILDTESNISRTLFSFLDKEQNKNYNTCYKYQQRNV